MKLTQIKNISEVLPNPIVGVRYDRGSRSQGYKEGFNQAIDAYNTLELEGDVEALAFVYSGDSEEDWEKGTEFFKNVCRKEAKSIIARMPQWVVMRKGGE